MTTLQPTQRVQAVDMFRAVTMFFMLFVNDIPRLGTTIPHWLHHAAMREDMMGFSDLIFPAFLFIMGVSVPFAIRNRLAKGDKIWQVLLHIGSRTLALVIMGLFTVNRDSLDSTLTGMSGNWFSILMVVGFFLLWGIYPKGENWRKWLFRGMKTSGAALLLYLFLIYKGENGAPFAQQWWGILGLIGWTYLVSALVYLVTRDSVIRNTIALVVFVGLMFLSKFGIFSIPYLPSDITLHLLGVTGLFVSSLMTHFGDVKKPSRLFYLLLPISAIMLVGGMLSHQEWIISKIMATPTWYFYCCSLFLPLFWGFYYLTDVAQKGNWFKLLRPAGIATLTCYIIPYAWYSVESLLYIHYPQFLNAGMPGLIKSAIFSLAVIGVVHLLLKVKVRLKV